MNEATCPRAQERLKLAMRNVNRLRKLVDVSCWPATVTRSLTDVLSRFFYLL
jgi:hypothetical protein